ncbi:MAG TPA: hypothetical protein VGJ22_02095 [Anaerolineales bacterium]
MKTPKTISRTEWAALILGVSMLLGIMVRIFPGLMVGFPINDGGMFMVMVRDLRANGLALPAFTEYNDASIPFAYPPFGFYVAALLGGAGIPALDVLRWLPMVVNFLSIPALYFLAATLLEDRAGAAVASAFFALTAGSYSWQIMGGGLTRALGMLFLVLAVLSVYLMFRRGEPKIVVLSIVLCSLAVTSHPEVSLATAASCALCWLFFGRTWRATGQAAIVAAGALLLTAPWWGTVLAQHGPAPFLSVVHSGAYVSSPLIAIFREYLAPASLLAPIGVFRLAGLAWSLWKRKYFLPVWMLLPYFAEPRSAPAMAFIAGCMLAAIGLTQALPWAVDRIARRPATEAALDFTKRNWLSISVLVTVLAMFVQSALYDFRLIKTSLVPPEPQDAMAWARDNTPLQSRFLILTGEHGIMTDPIQEWFPALAGRRSQTTLQGLEWTLGPDFFPRLSHLVDLQDCRDVACVENWSATTELDYTHVLIQKAPSMRPLLDAFSIDPDYQRIYDNPEAAIFVK